VNKRQLRRVVIETALAVVDTRGHDPEVCRQVNALIGSLDDMLPDERVTGIRSIESGQPNFYRTRCSLCVFKQSKPIKGQSVKFVHIEAGGALSPSLSPSPSLPLSPLRVRHRTPARFCGIEDYAYQHSPTNR
jgi:hypothetical protein